MAWTNVEITYGKNTYQAMQRGAEIVAPTSIGNPKTIKIDGEVVSVLEVQEDFRGEFVTLRVDCEYQEPADAEPEEEMSDDEPVEGGDDD